MLKSTSLWGIAALGLIAASVPNAQATIDCTQLADANVQHFHKITSFHQSTENTTFIEDAIEEPVQLLVNFRNQVLNKFSANSISTRDHLAVQGGLASLENMIRPLINFPGTGAEKHLFSLAECGQISGGLYTIIKDYAVDDKVQSFSALSDDQMRKVSKTVKSFFFALYSQPVCRSALDYAATHDAEAINQADPTGSIFNTTRAFFMTTIIANELQYVLPCLKNQLHSQFFFDGIQTINATASAENVSSEGQEKIETLDLQADAPSSAVDESASSEDDEEEEDYKYFF